MTKETKSKVIDGIQFASVAGLLGTAIANIIGGVCESKKADAAPAADASNPAPADSNVVEAPTQE